MGNAKQTDIYYQTYKEIVEKYVQGKEVIIDPFANQSKYGTITNDLNPEFETDFHLDALSFLKQIESNSADMVLFDPPYSITQAAQCYKDYGKEKLERNVANMGYWADCKNEVARILKSDGIALVCGWSSNGIGKTRGFEMLEILLVPHGGSKNDTIVTVEKKIMKLKILVGCEESQTVTKAFRALGHEAYSCDIQECSGGHPEWHLQMDVFEAMELIKPTIAIMHPPCTFLSRAGARWLYPTAGNLCQDRYAKGLEAKDFFIKCLNLDVEYIAVENPLPLKVFELPKESQVIQPYQYGHEFSKRTHLWLKNLPELKPTNIVSDFTPYLPSNTGGKKRGQKSTYRNISQKESSKTFQGIAEAMAKQWSDFVISQKQEK